MTACFITALLLTACSAGTAPRDTAEIPVVTAARDSVAALEPLPAESTASPAMELDVTEPRRVTCTRSRYLPSAAADLDADGRLERVSARHDGNDVVLTIHQLPDLEAERSLRFEAASLEVAVTRNRTGKGGQLWLHRGRIVDRAKNDWEFTVERVTGERRTVVSKFGGSSRPNLTLDLDGDGVVDPIVPGAKGPRALIKGVFRELVAKTTPDSIIGMNAPHELQQPVDLDGDGDGDLVSEHGDATLFIDAASFTETRRISPATVHAHIMPWTAAPGGFVAGLRLTGGGLRSRFVTADGAFTVMADYGEADDHARPTQRLVDVTGDGSILALQLLRTMAILRTPGGQPEPLELDLAFSGDPARPSARPGRFAGGSGPELIGIRSLSQGSPALGGQGETTYELRAVPPPGLGLGRLIHRGSLPGEGGASAQVLDLDGDGELEILLHETHNYMTCDMSGGGGTSIWTLMRGDGMVLWRDEPRHFSFGGRHRRDAQARVDLLDLGDGTRGLRVRTDTEEFWVFPAGGRPENLPDCLE